MTYSSDEIEGKVSQLVQGSSAYTVDGMGGRNVKDRFKDTRELVNSVFLYEPDGVYYLIFKAVARVRQQLSSVLSLMDDLSSDLDGMDISARPVEDTNALSDASNALSTISSALSRRGSISTSEYQRYEKATNRVLAKFKASAKRTYTPFSGTQATTDVVKSSAETAVELATDFDSFNSSYSALISAVDDLLAAYSDYDHETIVKGVASRQVDRAKVELDTLEASFDAASPDERSKTVRDDVLTVLSNRATIKALSRVRYPGDHKLYQGTSGSQLYRFSSYGVGTPPEITGSVSGPWPITSSHTLSIDFDTTGTVSVPLIPVTGSPVQGIKSATLTGSNAERTGLGFAIHENLPIPHSLLTKEIPVASNYAVNAKTLYIIIDGVLYSHTFSADGNAAFVAGELNTALGAVLTATAVVNLGQQWVNIAYTIPASPPALYENRYMEIASGLDDAADLRNWRVADPGGPTTTDATHGWDGNDELWIWANDLTEANALKVDLPNGDWPDYYVTATDASNAVDGKTGISSSVTSGKITITSDLSGEGSILEMISDGLSGYRKTPSFRGLETLGFYEEQDVREQDVDAQAIVNVLNDDDNFAAKATAELVVEEVFAERKAYASDTAEVSVDLDSNPLDGLTLGELKLSIESGENSGIYSIDSVNYTGSTLEITLSGRNLRDTSSEGFRIKVYKELIKITALSSATTSYIDVDQTDVNTAHIVLGLTEDLVRGTVNQLLIETNNPALGWVSANLTGFGIKIGDVVLDSSGAPITYVLGTDSIASGILDVSPVSPTLSVTAFSIKSISADRYDTFNDSLTSWREGVSDDAENLTDLTRSVNYLLTHKNPPRGRVEAAATDLQEIRDLLEGSSALSGVLESLSIDTIQAVDRALDVMTEQGHDRARDLLTRGKFTDFNATTYKTSSTSGAMMAASSSVAAKDLIEPTKTRREDVGEIARLISTDEAGIDPAYDWEDLKSGNKPMYLDYFDADSPEERR